jgi:hypothetical protein
LKKTLIKLYVKPTAYQGQTGRSIPSPSVHHYNLFLKMFYALAQGDNDLSKSITSMLKKRGRI